MALHKGQTNSGSFRKGRIISEKERKIKSETANKNWKEGKFKKGWIHTEESKKKIGQSSKNRKYPKEFGEKISKRLKDRKLSEKHKRKLSLAKIGKPANWIYSLKFNEIKKRLSENQRGNNNSNWKGGTTLLSDLIRNSFKYRQWRSDVFTRDDFTCQECIIRNGNGKTVYLEAHHIKEFNKIIEEYQIKTLEKALNCEELWNLNNGITLCKDCHNLTKNGRNKKFIN